MTLYSKIEGQGRPFLILHGFLGMSDNWKTLGTRYAENGFEVHMLDLRNHGRSFHSDDFSYEAMAEDIANYCDEHKLEKINLMGHSMGGKVAMFFAVAHPDKVDKLIIADIGVKYYRPHHQDILGALNAVDFSDNPSREDIDKTMEPLVPDFGTRQFLMKSLYRKTATQLAFRFNLEVFNKKIEQVGEALPEAARYEKPVLFLKGANSNYINNQDYENIRTHFPNAEFETIKNAGHWLHAENPNDFFDVTYTFLK